MMETRTRREPALSKGPAKGYYAESEAAAQLGLTREELRTLVRTHIASLDTPPDVLAGAKYWPRDLLTLRLIQMGMLPGAPAPTIIEPDNQPV